MINEFKNENFFLSNYYVVPVTYNGLTFQSNEAAFQAQKTLNEGQRRKFTKLAPNKAKAKGRNVLLREDWEEVKDQIMYEICLAKFTQNKELKEIAKRTWNFFANLLTPENHYLIPDNYQLNRENKVDMKTSPTDIGMSITSVISAYELGFIRIDEAFTIKLSPFSRP